MRIEVEWDDAEGVLDPVLARTWCGLSILVEDRPVTEYLATVSGSVRRSVRGSAFPLCAWLVSNWWSILNEAAPVDRVMEGARAMLRRSSEHENWVRRHGLLLAREGFALPDLLLFRDGRDVQLVWVPDPDEAPIGRRGRFIGSGRVRVPLEIVEEGLRRFVCCVLDRLDGTLAPEVEALRNDWEATQRATPEERDVCEVVASLGLDPFGVDEATWERFDDQTRRMASIPRTMRRDLLSVGTVGGLASEVRAVTEALASAGTRLARIWRAEMEIGPGTPAHQVGFRAARSLRSALGMAPTEPLPSGFDEWLAPISVRTCVEVLPGRTTRERRVVGLVASQGTALLHVAVRPTAAPTRRFAVGRAIGVSLVQLDTSDARLVTGGHDWTQRACRAFAAELLAPADGLRELAEAHRRASEEDTDSGADRDATTRLRDWFGADADVISFQSWNHGIDLTEN